MNKLKTLLLFLLPLTLLSCTDTREDLEIKKDGSGTLTMKTDFGKVLEMLKSMGGSNDLSKGGLDRAIDTTMFMKDVIDTAKNVPADQKELLRNGKVHMVVDVNAGKGKLDMNFPFTSAAKLQDLYASLNNSTSGLKGLFNGMGKNMPKSDSDEKDKGMPQIASVYDIVVKDGLYSRKVNKQRYDEFVQSMQLDQLKQMGSMFGNMDYTLTVKLPRSIKKVSNSKATLSEDKKTASLKTELMETFEHPELLALDIEY